MKALHDVLPLSFTHKLRVYYGIAVTPALLSNALFALLSAAVPLLIAGTVAALSAAGRNDSRCCACGWLL